MANNKETAKLNHPKTKPNLLNETPYEKEFTFNMVSVNSEICQKKNTIYGLSFEFDLYDRRKLIIFRFYFQQNQNRFTKWGNREIEKRITDVKNWY